MSAQHYDYFVIGAGSGGVRSARIAAAHGAKVGIAEASNLGGTCVNLGCIPKKLFAYAADYTMHFEDARGYGWATPEKIPFNWQTLIENKNKEIARLNGIYKTVLEKPGVEIIHGFAKFIDAHTLSIDDQIITADKILIATGGKPRVPAIEGGAMMATSDTVFHWPTLPHHVVIQGGGYIAVEFAHIFHGLGTHVTLLYRGDLFMRGFDHDIRTALAEEMRKQGMDLRFDCDVKKVDKNGPRYSVHTTQGDILECDLALAAIGRDPNIDKLNLDNANIHRSDNGQIAINEFYQTSQPHIYAVGDVANHHNLTPVAIAEGHVLADRLFGSKPQRSVNYNNIATAVFSHPPLATVGMTEEQALAAGHETQIYKSGFKPMKHTLSGRDERTLIKMIVEKSSDTVLGLHMMGQDAPEIIQGFAVALTAGAKKADFDRTIAVHPTSAEEFVLLK
jgi:glutathione reductase (NADPH)